MSALIELKDCFKTYTLDQDKVLSPADTVARVRERLAQADLDILADTERIDSGRLDIPVFISRCGLDAVGVMPTRKQMGKGATPAQAEASAVMELVERYSFFYFRSHEPFLRASYDQIRDRALPIEHLAASVHHDRNDLDRAAEALDGLPLSWTQAVNLTSGEACLIPFDWFYEINQFNGPAAGNALEEAAIQGMAEVVERHVSALAARGRLKLPSIDPKTLKNPVAVELFDKFRRHGIQVYLKDFTLDMGIPTVGALAYDPSTFPAMSEIVYTAGTATDPEKALIRTLTELAQLGGDFNTRSNFEASGLPKYTDLAQADYLTEPAPVVPIDALPDVSSDNIREEIDRATAALAAKGMPVYMLDVTHPRIGIPAVYTVIPGAHFRERAVGSSIPFFVAKLWAGQADPNAAMAGLHRLDRLFPSRYYIHFHQGRILLDQGRPAEAAQVLTASADMNPPQEDLASIMTYLGLARQQMEEYDQAIACLEKSAELDHDRRDTFNLLGFCYFKTKQHEKSIASFARVLELDPGSGIDYANIGSNFREMGRREEAVFYYRRALELDPTLDWVRENLERLQS